MTAQALLMVGPTLKVTASSVSGSASGYASCGSVSTSGQSPNTTVTGGSGIYTYSWAQTGTPATRGPYVISSATVANPTWSDTVCDGDAQSSEDWRVTVTDTVTGQTAEAIISVTLTWGNLS